MPQPKSYRYDWSKYCIPQFQKALGLEDDPEKLNTVRSTLKRMVDKYMLLDEIASNQHATLKVIFKKLKIIHPDLFDGEDSEKNLYFAEKVMMWQHRVKRGKAGKRQIPRKQRSPASSTSRAKAKQPSSASSASKAKSAALSANQTLPSLVESSHSTTPSTTPSRAHAGLSRTGTPIICSEASGSNVGSARTPLRGPYPPTPSSSSAKPQAQLQAHHPSTPSTSSQRTPPPPTPTSTPTPDPAETSTIRTFLLSCRPPQVHFLHHLIVAGYRSKAFLYAMAAWSDEYRYTTLKKILVDTLGRECCATEAQIAVLDYHLGRLGFEEEDAA